MCAPEQDRSNDQRKEGSHRAECSKSESCADGGRQRESCGEDPRVDQDEPGSCPGVEDCDGAAGCRGTPSEDDGDEVAQGAEEDLRAGVLPDERWSEHVVAELAPDLLVLVDPMLRAVWTSSAVSRTPTMSRRCSDGDGASPRRAVARR